MADPLDGTTNFFFQVPAYSVSLAACYQGEPVVGVVVDPSRHETWRAAQGRGAWRNETPCHVAGGRSQLATALVGTGFSYRPEQRVVQAGVLAYLLPGSGTSGSVGSAALDICWVANGRFDAYFESGLHYWDWAAGSVICQEAGGRIARLPGDIVIATTPDLMAPLTDLLARAQQEASGSR